MLLDKKSLNRNLIEVEIEIDNKDKETLNRMLMPNDEIL